MLIESAHMASGAYYSAVIYLLEKLLQLYQKRDTIGLVTLVQV